jgi:hypothetical protein
VVSPKNCKRGALGFAIVLSAEAWKAWERADSKILYFGPRILATRLRLHGTSRRRPLTLFLVSAYAPDSGKPQAEHEEYADALRQCFITCGRDILVVGTDTNSSIGVRSRNDYANAPDRDRVRGPFWYTARKLSWARAPCNLWASPARTSDDIFP